MIKNGVLRTLAAKVVQSRVHLKGMSQIKRTSYVKGMPHGHVSSKGTSQVKGAS